MSARTIYKAQILKKSKLITLLSSLNKIEFRNFEKFLGHSFFNKDQDSLKLFKILSRQYPDFEEKNIEKERVIKRLYKQEANKKIQQQFNYTMFNLTKTLEQYILWLELQEQDNDRHFLSLKAYKRRKLDKFFFKKAQEFKTELDKTEQRDAAYYNILYQLNLYIFHHPSTAKLDTEVDSFKNYVESFDLFLLSTKLIQISAILNRQFVVDEQFTIHLENAVLSKIKESPFSNYPLLQIYDILIAYQQNRKTPDPEAFPKAKALFLEHLSLFGKNEQASIASLLLNFAITLYNNGHDEFLWEQFEFYQFIEQEKLLHQKDESHPVIFFNTVQAACELGELEWVFQFIQSKEDSILKEDNMFLLAKAYYHSCNGEHDETLELLRDVHKFEFYYHNITAKALMLRTYYEQDELDLFDYLVNSFSVYIRRNNKMSPYMKEQILNFIKICNRLFQNKNYEADESEHLLKLLQTDKLFYRAWLKRQAAQIIDRRK